MKELQSFYQIWNLNFTTGGGGALTYKGGMGMCGPEDPLFTPLLPLARVPFQAKESVHKKPFWENFEILASTASIFTQILAHKPQIWKFSAHKPPNLEIFRSQAPLFKGKCQFASPTLRKYGPHTPTWKKVECPPPPGFTIKANPSVPRQYIFLGHSFLGKTLLYPFENDILTHDE